MSIRVQERWTRNVFNAEYRLRARFCLLAIGILPRLGFSSIDFRLSILDYPLACTDARACKQSATVKRDYFRSPGRTFYYVVFPLSLSLSFSFSLFLSFSYGTYKQRNSS